MAFSADGRTLAVTAGRSVHLVDVTDPTTPRLLGLTREFAGAAQFAGTNLLLTVARTAVHLWDTTDPRNPAAYAEIPSGGGEVTAAWVSGQSLAVATDDGLVRLWQLADLRRPVELALLRGHAGPVTAVGLTLKGDEIVTGGADRAIRLWNVDPRDPADRICAQARPRMSGADWEKYFPGVSFLPPCRD